VCARGSNRALLRGPSTSPLDVMGSDASVLVMQQEIPRDWWIFCEMDDFKPLSPYYPYAIPRDQTVEVVPLVELEPPQRSAGAPAFRKYKLVPILLAFRSPECRLPPVQVEAANSGPYRFKLVNGFHRFYASVAVGYSHLPVCERQSSPP
jgi:hypothetical protein